MGNCTEKRQNMPCLQRKKEQGLLHFFPTFDLKGQSDNDLQFQEQSIVSDGFDKFHEVSNGRDMKNLIKVQHLRIPYFNASSEGIPIVKQLIVEVGYGINFQKLLCQINVTSYPFQLKPQITQDSTFYWFQVLRWQQLQGQDDMNLSEDDFILFELVQANKVIAYSLVSMVCLWDQKVKELELDFSNPLEMLDIYGRDQIKPLGKYDMKVWVRLQYLVDIHRLHEQQKQELSAYRNQYAI